MNKIKVYTAVKMTGRMCDELVQESQMLIHTLQNYGLEVLNPVIEENVPYIHEPLTQTNNEQLEKYWQRDKEMIRECDILLDYKSCNMSDGVNKEIGYARWCLWKPVVRVFPNAPLNISRLEDDIICNSLNEAINLVFTKWGTYDKLKEWRTQMWHKSFANWLQEQYKMNNRYNVPIKLGVL